MKKNKQNESCAQPETTVTFGLINDLIISLQNCSNCSVRSEFPKCVIWISVT